MADNYRFLYTKMRQQLVRVVRQLLEAVLIISGFSGAAKTDLIRRDDAIARLAQGANALFPGRAAEILAVQQHHGLTIGVVCRFYIHIAHTERLLLRGKIKALKRERIVKAFQLLTISRCG